MLIPERSTPLYLSMRDCPTPTGLPCGSLGVPGPVSSQQIPSCAGWLPAPASGAPESSGELSNLRVKSAGSLPCTPQRGPDPHPHFEYYFPRQLLPGRKTRNVTVSKQTAVSRLLTAGRAPKHAFLCSLKPPIHHESPSGVGNASGLASQK